MRQRSVINGDIRFQYKYGFYFIYLIFTIIYIFILSLLPDSVRKEVTAVLTYSDPAAMGMFFMGAIILLEKSQRVLNSIAISPVTVTEYIMGKLVSIGVISAIVGMILAAAGGNSIWRAGLITFIGSMLFSLCGLLVGSKTRSLNQFMVMTLPLEMIFFIPPVYYLFYEGKLKELFLLHPGCAMISLILNENRSILLCICSIAVWLLFFFLLTKRRITKMFESVGGIRL